MSNFVRIVRNYEQISRLGRQIIAHKDLVRKIHPDKLEEEFTKQELRIQEFVEATKYADDAWKDNPHVINSYWTGLS